MLILIVTKKITCGVRAFCWLGESESGTDDNNETRKVAKILGLSTHDEINAKEKAVAASYVIDVLKASGYTIDSSSVTPLDIK